MLEIALESNLGSTPRFYRESTRRGPGWTVELPVGPLLVIVSGPFWFTPKSPREEGSGEGRDSPPPSLPELCPLGDT